MSSLRMIEPWLSKPRPAARSAIGHGQALHPAVRRQLSRDSRLARSLVVDLSGNVLLCGGVMAQLLGVAPAAWVGRRVEELLPGLTLNRLAMQRGMAPDMAFAGAEMRRPVARIIDTTRRAWGLRAAVAAQRLILASGQTLTVDLAYGALEVCDGPLLEIQARSKAAQSRLERLVGSAEQSPAAVLIADGVGQIAYVNPVFEDRSGYFCCELAGRSVTLLEPPAAAERPAPPGGLSRALRARRPWLGEVALRDSRGRIFHEQMKIRPCAIGDSMVTHVVCIGHDGNESEWSAVQTP